MTRPEIGQIWEDVQYPYTIKITKITWEKHPTQEGNVEIVGGVMM